MMRFSPCAASGRRHGRAVARPRGPCRSRRSPARARPCPRNWTLRRLSDSGPPPASVAARATWAIEYRPCRIRPGRPDRLGELLVDVDRVVVARRARVADGEEAVGGDPQLGDLSPAFISDSSHDVGPGAGAHRLAVLVGRDRLEDVVAAAVARLDRLALDVRGDLVAGDHERAPARTPARRGPSSRSSCATSGSKITGPIAGRAVDDREHRRRDHVGVAGGPGGLVVEVQRVRLAHGERVLLDLLAADRVDGGPRSCRRRRS